MTAIDLTLGLLKPGDHLIVSGLIYGCSFKLFQDFCERYNIDLDFADLTDPRSLKSLLKPRTRMVFFETPTNPFLKTIDIAAVSAEVKRRAPSALIVVDNTWATPYFQKPLKLGADLCVYSATKFYSGHSDCMGGMISTDRDALADQLRELRFYSGAILDPHSAWLLRRSLQTFTLRMDEHERVVLEMKRFLQARKEVAKVYFPRIDRKQLRGYGCILFFEFKPRYSRKAPAFAGALKLFEAGTSMACVVSSVARPYTGSHLSLTPAEKSGMGIKESLVRLCFGFEDIDDLKDDLRLAFQQIA
jgi:cystathionine gamma-lyase/cystathionine gamma-lyase/homocysteine desulfhydrase